jgi:hypothetical protein
MPPQQDLVEEIITDHREMQDAFAEIERDGEKTAATSSSTSSPIGPVA